ncbi:MAG: Type 1 glutamine amidotransferase-like domain-containing protein [Chloroflexi bacterium]|nr:Type 1 glutamine amidotransferase-like domain-containing protein [Chloroflexota bacterium]
MRLKQAIVALALFLALAGDHTLSQSIEPLLIPIGGGYANTLQGVVEAALERNGNGSLNIAVLPVTFASSADGISDEERTLNLRDADKRRAQLQAVCEEWSAGLPCIVTLAPVLTRADAEDPVNVALFDERADLDAVFILGGDQAIAMQALHGTPLEAALAAAYARGVIVAGTSAGLAVQSRTMIGGYSADRFDAPVGDDFAAEKHLAAAALQAGMVDLWQQRRRGLSFGVTDALLEQHFWERSRLPRLLNALAQPGVPRVGIGVDSYTGARLRGGDCLEDVFGLYTIGILDAETYGAAETATFDHDGILSVQNVLFHTLAPGDFSYSLRLRQHSLAALPASAAREFASLALPDGAGPLILGGKLNPDAFETQPNPVIERLRQLTGQANPTVWVIGPDLIRAGGNLSQLLTDEVDAIVVRFDDQAVIQPEQLAFLKAFWLSGRPLLLDDAAAALAGAVYAAHPPLPVGDKVALEAATQGSLIQGSTDIRAGLGLLDVLVEPRVAGDNRWGRLLSLVYAHPDRLALGLNDGAALEITADGARVIGDNGVFRFDLRQATLALGTTGGLVIANGWLDVFAPGERLDTF